MTSAHGPSLFDELMKTLAALASGAARPAQGGTVLVIVAALVGAALIARIINRRVDGRLARVMEEHGRAVDALRFSIEGVRRLAFPVVAQGLLWLGEVVLRLAGLLHTHDEARVLRLAMTLLAAMALVRLLVYAMRRAFKSATLLATFERLIVATICTVVALHVTGLLADVVDWLEATGIPVGKGHVSLWVLLVGAVSVALTVLVALWSGSIIEARLMGAESIDPNFRVVLARVVRALLVVVAVLVALSLTGIDLTVLSVFGGALGVGLGLGLQRIASNYVSGFILLLDRSLRIGDLITVGAQSGTVTQINTRYTVIRALDGTEAIVPNEVLVSTAVTNLSSADRRVQVLVRVSVAQGTDIDRALQLLAEAARGQPRVLDDPAPFALLAGFGTDGLDIDVGFWVRNPEEDRAAVRSDVARSMLRCLRREGIEIPFAQRDVRLTRLSSGASARRSSLDLKDPEPASNSPEGIRQGDVSFK